MVAVVSVQGRRERSAERGCLPRTEEQDGALHGDRSFFSESFSGFSLRAACVVVDTLSSFP